MSAGDPPIIIQGGGSFTVNFGSSHGQFTDDGNGKHHHSDKHLERIEIIGDGADFKADFPTGNVTIKVYYGPSKTSP
jgi:hypothetical protein